MSSFTIVGEEMGSNRIILNPLELYEKRMGEWKDITPKSTSMSEGNFNSTNQLLKKENEEQDLDSLAEEIQKERMLESKKQLFPKPDIDKLGNPIYKHRSKRTSGFRTDYDFETGIHIEIVDYITPINYDYYESADLTFNVDSTFDGDEKDFQDSAKFSADVESTFDSDEKDFQDSATFSADVEFGKENPNRELVISVYEICFGFSLPKERPNSLSTFQTIWNNTSSLTLLKKPLFDQLEMIWSLVINLRHASYLCSRSSKKFTITEIGLFYMLPIYCDDYERDFEELCGFWTSLVIIPKSIVLKCQTKKVDNTIPYFVIMGSPRFPTKDFAEFPLHNWVKYDDDDSQYHVALDLDTHDRVSLRPYISIQDICHRLSQS